MKLHYLALRSTKMNFLFLLQWKETKTRNRTLTVSNRGDRWLPDSPDGYHVKYINSESVCCISETQIILSINQASRKKFKNKIVPIIPLSGILSCVSLSPRLGMPDLLICF